MVSQSQEHPIDHYHFLPPQNHNVAKKLSGLQELPGLIFMATPIGNLLDISLRALKILENCDIIYCEDTRHTKKLLSFYNIKKPLYSYHEYSSEKSREHFLTQLQNHNSIVYVSDAGTPLISDPGFQLTKLCVEHNINITMIPGPSAPIMALALSGLPTDQFCFLGFIPPKEQARQKFFAQIEDYKMTLIFFETPTRLVKSLSVIDQLYPHRQIVVAKEMTKLHEAFFRGTAKEILQNINNHPVKGELVLLLEGQRQTKCENITDDEIRRILQEKSKSMTMKNAVNALAQETGLAKKRIYNISLAMKKQSD